jgi:hypothetical protein
MLIWYALRGAPTTAFVAVSSIGALLLVYNLVRIARARAALREPATLARFAEGQRRSHRIRGRIYLVGTPIVLGVTWMGVLMSGRVDADAWVVLAVITAFLVAGWVFWLRVLRRMASR